MERFLRACPSLAAQVARYESTAADFPDVDVHMNNGTKSQIELGEWIDGKQLAAAAGVPRSGGSYDPKDALNAATRILLKKVTHYGPAARGVWLVIYYDRAILYNTPFHSLSIDDFEGVAGLVADTLKGQNVTFDRIYLLAARGDIDGELAAALREAGIAFKEGPEAFEIFPALARCL